MKVDSGCVRRYCARAGALEGERLRARLRSCPRLSIPSTLWGLARSRALSKAVVCQSDGNELGRGQFLSKRDLRPRPVESIHGA
jgi:hypothetical protein